MMNFLKKSKQICKVKVFNGMKKKKDSHKNNKVMLLKLENFKVQNSQFNELIIKLIFYCFINNVKF